jgi:hypothetical protein
MRCEAFHEVKPTDRVRAGVNSSLEIATRTRQKTVFLSPKDVTVELKITAR